MGIFSWIIMGLIVGALAKFLMPGKDPGQEGYSVRAAKDALHASVGSLHITIKY
jgi:hypothetical protein